MAGRKRFMQNFKLMLVYKKTLIEQYLGKTARFCGSETTQTTKQTVFAGASSLMNVNIVKEELC